jgi:hypothetical protein
MSESTENWAPGDRVLVELPDLDGVLGYRGRMHWFPGTVRDVDSGPRPGVRVDLDDPLNGLSDCYASHAELRRLPAASGEGTGSKAKEG